MDIIYPRATRVGPLFLEMGASINRGPQNKPKYIMVLIIGITKEGPLIFGSPQMALNYGSLFEGYLAWYSCGFIRIPNQGPILGGQRIWDIVPGSLGGGPKQENGMELINHLAVDGT